MLLGPARHGATRASLATLGLQRLLQSQSEQSIRVFSRGEFCSGACVGWFFTLSIVAFCIDLIGTRNIGSRSNGAVPTPRRTRPLIRSNSDNRSYFYLITSYSFHFCRFADRNRSPAKQESPSAPIVTNGSKSSELIDHPRYGRGIWRSKYKIEALASSSSVGEVVVDAYAADGVKVKFLWDDIVDRTFSLRIDEKDTIKDIVHRIYDSSNVFVRVCIVPNLPIGYKSSKYCAQDLAKLWGFSSGRFENSVLVFVSIADERVEIEIGPRMGAALPFHFVDHVQHRIILRELHAGKIGQGIISGLNTILYQLKHNSGSIGSASLAQYRPHDQLGHSQAAGALRVDSQRPAGTPRSESDDIIGFDLFESLGSTLRWALILASLYALWLMQRKHVCPKCNHDTLYDDNISSYRYLHEYGRQLTQAEIADLEAGRMRLVIERCSNCGFSRTTKRFGGKMYAKVAPKSHPEHHRVPHQPHIYTATAAAHQQLSPEEQEDERIATIKANRSDIVN